MRLAVSGETPWASGLQGALLPCCEHNGSALLACAVPPTFAQSLGTRLASSVGTSTR